MDKRMPQKKTIQRSEYFAKIGREGGLKAKKTQSPEFFARIGKLGGQSLKAKYGPDYYRIIGRRGGLAVRRLVQLAKLATGEVAKKE